MTMIGQVEYLNTSAGKLLHIRHTGYIENIDYCQKICPPLSISKVKVNLIRNSISLQSYLRFFLRLGKCKKYYMARHHRSGIPTGTY